MSDLYSIENCAKIEKWCQTLEMKINLNLDQEKV